MPDAGGRFKGISVPALPWLRPPSVLSQDELREKITELEAAEASPMLLASLRRLVN